MFLLHTETNIELCQKMLKDEKFLNRLKQKLLLSKSLIIDSKIEGASLYRDLCKVINNFLSIEFEELYDDDEENEDNSSKSTSRRSSKNRPKTADLSRLILLEFFCNYLEIPVFFVEFLKLSISNKSNLKILKEVFYFVSFFSIKFRLKCECLYKIKLNIFKASLV